MEARVQDLKSWRWLHIGWMLLACVVIEMPVIIALFGEGSLSERLVAEADGEAADLALLLLGLGAVLFMSLYVGLGIFVRNFIAFMKAHGLSETANELRHNEG